MINFTKMYLGKGHTDHFFTSSTFTGDEKKQGRAKKCVRNYQYKYNGQELQTELGLNWYTYRYRNYDATTGRFFGVDPITEKYYNISTYQFAHNNPIWKIEIEGLEGQPTTNDDLMSRAGDWFSGIGQGIGNSLNKTYEGVKQLITDPVGTVESAVNNLGAIVKSIQGQIIVSKEMVTPGSPLQQMVAKEALSGNTKGAGALVGELWADGAQEVVGLKGVGKGIKTAGMVAKVGMAAKRMNLAKAWGVATEYVDTAKKVYTSTVTEGTELIQYRVGSKGKGTVGNYYALPGTSPEAVGISSSAVTETLRVRVTSRTKVLNSTHTTNATFYADKSVTVSGGGKQIYSTQLKNNIEIISKQ